MREQDYHKAVAEARQRQLDGVATDDDRRYLKQAEADGIDADELIGDQPDKEAPSWDGDSSSQSKTRTAKQPAKSAQSRRSPARSTGNPSTSASKGSDTAPAETTSGPATDGAEIVAPADTAS